jgi:hypothetical protein
MNTAVTRDMRTGPALKRAGQDDERAERRECDALRTRVCILEAALASIAREAEVAQREPEVSFLAIHRIASVARQTIGGGHEAS